MQSSGQSLMPAGLDTGQDRNPETQDEHTCRRCLKVGARRLALTSEQKATHVDDHITIEAITGAASAPRQSDILHTCFPTFLKPTSAQPCVEPDLCQRCLLSAVPRETATSAQKLEHVEDHITMECRLPRLDPNVAARLVGATTHSQWMRACFPAFLENGTGGSYSGATETIGANKTFPSRNVLITNKPLAAKTQKYTRRKTIQSKNCQINGDDDKVNSKSKRLPNQNVLQTKPRCVFETQLIAIIRDSNGYLPVSSPPQLQRNESDRPTVVPSMPALLPETSQPKVSGRSPRYHRRDSNESLWKQEDNVPDDDRLVTRLWATVPTTLPCKRPIERSAKKRPTTYASNDIGRSHANEVSALASISATLCNTPDSTQQRDGKFKTLPALERTIDTLNDKQSTYVAGHINTTRAVGQRLVSELRESTVKFNSTANAVSSKGAMKRLPKAAKTTKDSKTCERFENTIAYQKEFNELYALPTWVSQANRLKIGLDAIYSKTQAEPFICDECGRGLKSLENLALHQANHRDLWPFQCPECGQQYKFSATLRLHMTKHVTARDFVCDDCSDAFKDKYTLLGHVTIHTGARPFECGVCAMTFRVRVLLRQHQRRFGHLT